MTENNKSTGQGGNCKPAEYVINEIRALLNNGSLKPGDKLPAERKLAEQYGVSRAHVREAIKKLEFYGIVKVHPQSGTVISGMGITALDGLITDILKLDTYDFFSLVELRVILEREAARLCAERRTESDLCELEQALNEYMNAGDENISVEKDFNFHRKIVAGSKNNVLNSMLLFITPEIMKTYQERHVCEKASQQIKQEHHDLLDCIRRQDALQAADLAEKHLKDVIDFAKELAS